MSSICSSPTHSSSHQDEDSSSWWDDVFEARDLLSDREGQSRDLGMKKMLPTNQDTLQVGQCSLPLLPPKRSLVSERRSSPSDLKVAAAKLSLNSGKEHVNFVGKVRRARQLKKPCHERCNRCEEPRINPAERQEIFDIFWNLSDHVRQWLFIYGSVKTSTPRCKTAVGGGKNTTRNYYFNLAGKSRRVCKTMFKNTLCICDSWIDSALSHYSKDGYKPDMRGKVHRSARKRKEVTNQEESD